MDEPVRAGLMEQLQWFRTGMGTNACAVSLPYTLDGHALDCFRLFETRVELYSPATRPLSSLLTILAPTPSSPRSIPTTPQCILVSAYTASCYAYAAVAWLSTSADIQNRIPSFHSSIDDIVSSLPLMPPSNQPSSH